jgi:hypothetical protein
MTTTRPDLDTATAVLGYARGRRADADRAEADVLFAAVTWAEQHPPESIALAATWPGTEDDLTLAGPGAPLVAEFCIAELALALGVSTDSGRVLIAHALELKYRLPRTYRRVQSAGDPGGLTPWKARRIAEATLGLSMEAATFVDQQVAGFAHKIGPAQLERLVGEAVARFMPDLAEQHASDAADRRHVKFFHDQIGFDGTTRMEAELDLADALDLDAAITAEAEQLRVAGSTESLDVRRAIAAGQIGRKQLTLDLNGTQESAGTSSPQKKARQVVLYVHLAEAALTGTGSQLDLPRLENHHRGVTADQVRTWCLKPDTAVTVKPVIGLNEHISVEAYEIPDRLREQVELANGTCVFPWCHRPARRCDCDHVIPHNEGGPTCSCNTAPLCRRHHRLKTHSPWTYTVLEPGTFLWTSPHRYQYLRDHTGTADVTPNHQPNKSDPPTDPPHY